MISSSPLFVCFVYFVVSTAFTAGTNRRTRGNVLPACGRAPASTAVPRAELSRPGCKVYIRPRPGPLPHERENRSPIFLKIYATELAGRSSANPETVESYFLSWGRGSKVRADVNTHSIKDVEQASMERRSPHRLEQVIPFELAEPVFGAPGASKQTFHFHGGGEAVQIFAARDFNGAQRLGWRASPSGCQTTQNRARANAGPDDAAQPWRRR